MTAAHLDWRVRTALAAVDFFGVASHQQALTVLGKSDPPGTYQPFLGVDFLTYLSRTGTDSSPPRASQIDLVLRGLVHAGYLGEMPGMLAPQLGNRYVTTVRILDPQRAGLLWLAPALGPGFLAPLAGSATIAVTGTNADGDVRCGSGLLVDREHILTCAHVITDMTVDEVFDDPTEQAPLNGSPRPAGHLRRVGCELDTARDVAVIIVDPSESSAQPISGLRLRSPGWADDLTMLGYPRVPNSRTAPLVVQRGEVVNPSVTTFDGLDVFLLSAITRPGNSGGPIFASDGYLVGMAVRELSSRDNAAPSSKSGSASDDPYWRPPDPFYAALPAHIIVQALEDFGLATLMPGLE